MHRRWMSLPLLSSCVTAFYPYPEVDLSAVQGDKVKRFVPYHHTQDDNVDGLVTIDIKRVYKRDNKFPIVTSNAPSAPNALAINQDGSDFSYISTMKFGSEGQEMHMLIDTGSANTWVFGESCASKSCGIHNLFGQGDSTTLQTTANKWSLTYGTGSVTGIVASDTVTFANFSLNLGFGLATTASDDFLSYPMDGILGLGRAPTNELNTPTVMEVLATQGKLQSKTLGIRIHRADDNTKDGEIIFGGVDSSKFTGQISYTSTSNTNSWEIPVEDAFVGDKPCNFVNKKAIIDTGTSYLLMPPSDAQTLHKLIPGSSASGEDFIVPCDTSTTIQVGFSGTKWNISPKDYVGNAAPSGNGCVSNIVGHQAYGPDEWILGDVFLKNVYAVFDFDNARIGFATLASGSSSGSSSTTSGSSSSGMTTSTVSSSTASATASRTTSSQSSPSADIGNPFDYSTGDGSSSSSNSGSGNSATNQNAAPSTFRAGFFGSELGICYLMLIAFLIGITV